MAEKRCKCSKHDTLTHNGEELSVMQWAEHLGCSIPAMMRRVRVYGLDDPRTFMNSEELKAEQRAIAHKANRKKGGGNAEWKQLSDEPRMAAE